MYYVVIYTLFKTTATTKGKKMKEKDRNYRDNFTVKSGYAYTAEIKPTSNFTQEDIEDSSQQFLAFCAAMDTRNGGGKSSFNLQIRTTGPVGAHGKGKPRSFYTNISLTLDEIKALAEYANNYVNNG